MSSNKLNKYLENKNKNRIFSNKTFNDFRQDLLKYANEFYSEQIIDFTESSLGGMFLDFASIVGDSLVYYAEQQFNELDYATATDPDLITKHLQKANIKTPKASPASAQVSFNFLIPIDNNLSTLDNLIPMKEYTPYVKKGTILNSSSGIDFILLEDLDFTKNTTISIGEEDENGNVLTLSVSKEGTCSSAKIGEESITFSDSASKYLSFTLENEQITNIISVRDNDFNEYYEVEYLSQDTVYKKVKNANDENYMSILPAPYRYIIEEDYANSKTILRFGAGDAYSVKDDAFANPEDLLLPLKGKDVIGRLDLAPGDLLNSNTLGISPVGKTITVTYKYGGGLSHNVRANDINQISNLLIKFPYNEDELDTNVIEESLFVNNDEKASGGDVPITFDELVDMLPMTLKSQSRIINKEDLLSRLMTMPTDFGRINKIAALDNLYFAQQKDLFVVCKDNEGFYSNATDALKINISKYINEYRSLGDRYNIFDASIFNFGLKIKIRIKSEYSPENVIFEATNDIIRLMRFDLLDIGSPIDIDKIYKIIEVNPGVSTILTPKTNAILSKSNNSITFSNDQEVLTYQNTEFSPVSQHVEGYIHPPRGGIFELRYPVQDIEIIVSD